MTIKDKLKSYNFWITLVSAIILLLQIFGDKFNFKVDSNFIIDVTTALCSIFVVLGIISVPKSKQVKTEVQVINPDYNQICQTISTDISDKLNTLISEIKTNQESLTDENKEKEVSEEENINEVKEADFDFVNTKDVQIKAEDYTLKEDEINKETNINENNQTCLESSILISDNNNPIE